MVDAATHQRQLGELVGIGADIALISAQQDQISPGAAGGGGYSNLMVPILVGRFLRWSMINELLAAGLLIFIAAAAVYGVASFFQAVGEVE